MMVFTQKNNQENSFCAPPYDIFSFKISIFVDVRSVFKMVKEKLGNEVLYRQRLIKYGMLN